ncbi:type IV toxin-antitoxin system AbiEi family antitoxin domain-containing protein [Streptomyces sp. NPDC001297]|uniref:type IV toxin-antitoxin system AbiEi family antitoxin domain-containing protein n=1 Tax=Streptomyces sp. NPDC001297 TaxID=3364559 RepID=UPI0036952A62
MDSAEQLAVLSGPAADQWGLVTAAQAKELGLNAVQLLRLTEAGLLENVSRGVYLLAASGTPRHVDIKAAWLRLQPKTFVWDRRPGHPDSGVISHASACQLHELGDIPAPDVEITVPRRRTTTEPFVRLRTAPLDADEITVADGLPVTTALRTITDLLQAKADGGHIGGVIAAAVRRDLVDVDDLAGRVQPYARKYGLKATATGRQLISHLIEQAGESLHRQDVARASKEGFDAAVQLLSGHPDLAAYLADQTAGQHGKARNALSAQPVTGLPAHMARALSNYPDMGELAGIRAALEDVNRQLAQPGLYRMIRELNRQMSRPDSAWAATLRKLSRPNPAWTAGLAKPPLPNPTIAKALQEINRQLSQSSGAVAATLGKLPQPDPAARNALAHSPVVRRALEAPAGTTATQQPAPPPDPTDAPDSTPGDGRAEAENS